MRKVVKILVGIVGVLILFFITGGIYIYCTAPHLFRFSEHVTESVVKRHIKDIEGSVFIHGMQGCENVYVDSMSMAVYVTALDGFIYLLDGPSREALKIVGSKRVGTFALGIDKGPDGNIYVGVCSRDQKGWIDPGGAIHRLDPGLTREEILTGEYPGLNGLAFDADGNLYFASARFNMFEALNPRGNIFVMQVDKTGIAAKPDLFLKNIGWANGVYYHPPMNVVFFSNTIEGVFSFSPGNRLYQPVYYKTKFMESCDDLCVDSRGRLWMTDPGNSFLKMYDSANNTLVRFIVDGVGQTSACEIRREAGKEIIYVTELKQSQSPMGKVYDGRGVVIVALDALMGAP